MKQTAKISAVIPTLNAAATLPDALAAISQADEIVIVDGGSEDATVAQALAAGARVVTAPRGRGQQLAAGIATATHNWLLLLHADTRLEPGWLAEAATHMRANPDLAGYFRFALDSTDPQARWLERLVALRCRIFALPYGDQGLLLHRDTLRAAGGMRPLPLMEDIDLIRRIGRRRLIGLHTAAVTSAAKWERDGWYRRSCRNLLCLSLWRLGVPPATIERLYR